MFVVILNAEKSNQFVSHYSELYVLAYVAVQ